MAELGRRAEPDLVVDHAEDRERGDRRGELQQRAHHRAQPGPPGHARLGWRRHPPRLEHEQREHERHRRAGQRGGAEREAGEHRAPRLDRGPRVDQREHDADDVRRVPDLALDRREEQHAAEREHGDEPQVLAHACACDSPASASRRRTQQRQRQDQRGDQERRDHVVAAAAGQDRRRAASAPRGTAGTTCTRSRCARPVGRAVDGSSVAVERAEHGAGAQPAARDLAAVVELDGLDLGPVIALERRRDRELAVQPRIGLIDEVRRRRTAGRAGPTRPPRRRRGRSRTARRTGAPADVSPAGGRMVV